MENEALELLTHIRTLLALIFATLFSAACVIAIALQLMINILKKDDKKES